MYQLKDKDVHGHFFADLLAAVCNPVSSMWIEKPLTMMNFSFSMLNKYKHSCHSYRCTLHVTLDAVPYVRESNSEDLMKIYYYRCDNDY